MCRESKFCGKVISILEGPPHIYIYTYIWLIICLSKINALSNLLPKLVLKNSGRSSRPSWLVYHFVALVIEGLGLQRENEREKLLELA